VLIEGKKKEMITKIEVKCGKTETGIDKIINAL
jgi:hypothetical protein